MYLGALRPKRSARLGGPAPRPARKTANRLIYSTVEPRVYAKKMRSAVTKHALSGDSTSEIEARRQAVGSAPMRAGTSRWRDLGAQTLKKKAFSRRQNRENACVRALMCYFSRRLSTARATPRLLTAFEE
jgi:hypothetical protein